MTEPCFNCTRQKPLPKEGPANSTDRRIEDLDERERELTRLLHGKGFEVQREF